MALYYGLPVFKDVYKLTLLIYGLTKDVSEEYKYTLGQDLKKDVLVLMRSIYRATKAQNMKKRQVLIPRLGKSLSLTFLSRLRKRKHSWMMLGSNFNWL
jgi:hypothetical protein